MHKQLENHVCIISIVANGALGVKHQVISIFIADGVVFSLVLGIYCTVPVSHIKIISTPYNMRN